MIVKEQRTVQEKRKVKVKDAKKKTLNPLSISLDPFISDPLKNPKPSYQGV